MSEKKYRIVKDIQHTGGYYYPHVIRFDDSVPSYFNNSNYPIGRTFNPLNKTPPGMGDFPFVAVAPSFTNFTIGRPFFDKPIVEIPKELTAGTKQVRAIVPMMPFIPNNFYVRIVGNFDDVYIPLSINNSRRVLDYIYFNALDRTGIPDSDVVKFLVVGPGINHEVFTSVNKMRSIVDRLKGGNNINFMDKTGKIINDIVTNTISSKISGIGSTLVNKYEKIQVN